MFGDQLGLVGLDASDRHPGEVEIGQFGGAAATSCGRFSPNRR